MAKQTISVGTAANDGTGDTLHAGSEKINANFTELYATRTVVDTGFVANSHAGDRTVVVPQFQGPGNGGASYSGAEGVSLANLDALANHVDKLNEKFLALYETVRLLKFPNA